MTKKPRLKQRDKEDRRKNRKLCLAQARVLHHQHDLRTGLMGPHL